MIIFDENNSPVILNSITGPTLVNYMWTLDLSILDFTLAPLIMLEEIVCPGMQICVRGFEFILPASWNILVYDQDTSQLDVVQVCDTGGREFTALVFGPDKNTPVASKISATNYYPEITHIGPSLNKHQMIGAAVSPEEFVLVSPSDGFNKYLKDLTVSDLIGL